MTIELKMLAWSAVLGLIQILLSAHSASLQVGYRYTARPDRRSPASRGGSSERSAISWRPSHSSRRPSCSCTSQAGTDR